MTEKEKNLRFGETFLGFLGFRLFEEICPNKKKKNNNNKMSSDMRSVPDLTSTDQEQTGLAAYSRGRRFVFTY